jgi:type II secretory pathway pseudopilin PulG
MNGIAGTREFPLRDDYRGFSLMELLAASLLVLLLFGLALPALAQMRYRAERLGAAAEIQGLVSRGRLQALQQGVMVGIHFERTPDGRFQCQLFKDGNANGVTAADRERGIDPPVTAPLPLFRETGFKPELPPGTAPAVPPARGNFQGGDAVALTGDTLSFSPLGTFSNGSIYLGDGREFLCLRLAGNLGRIRIFRWKPGQSAWQEVVQ